MKKLIKILTPILILFLVTSCSRRTADFSTGAVISDVEEGYDGCYYYTSTTADAGILWKGVFFDRCGKYTVGDTVRTVKWSR